VPRSAKPRRVKRVVVAALAVSAVTLCAGRGQAHAASQGPLDLDVTHWGVVARESGPVNYYQVVNDASMPFIHAHYTPPEATTVLGMQLADADRKDARSISWQWRAVTLPKGGDECAGGREDSAAVVYLTWKGGLKWYTIKDVWSAVGKVGAICDRKRNPFVAQDTVILESGGPLNVWRTETIDLKQEFRRHFDDGNPNGDVPDFVGVGIMTDGDQTKSESAADYAAFILQR
jgi:Protein of unknown function (DUF3047)